MEPHHHPAPAAVLNRVVQPDAAGALHVFYAVEALQETGHDEGRFGEAELFCGTGMISGGEVGDDLVRVEEA